MNLDLWPHIPSRQVRAPFVCFYGGKFRAAKHYPPPRFPRIFEPCAGFAGYSMRYSNLDVVLVEADPTIASVWRWLIGATSADIMALPIDITGTVQDLGLAPGPTAFIGFWLNKGTSSPRHRPAAWMRDARYRDQFWGAHVRARTAAQVDAIHHWTIIEGDYTEAPNEEGTWFIDPTYELAGRHYKVRVKDHRALGQWCRTRRGQVIVCENDGANWLPFRPFREIKSRIGHSREAIWTND